MNLWPTTFFLLVGLYTSYTLAMYVVYRSGDRPRTTNSNSVCVSFPDFLFSLVATTVRTSFSTLLTAAVITACFTYVQVRFLSNKPDLVSFSLRLSSPSSSNFAFSPLHSHFIIFFSLSLFFFYILFLFCLTAVTPFSWSSQPQSSFPRFHFFFCFTFIFYNTTYAHTR